MRWYPAPEGAKVMSDHHRYASAHWLRDKKQKWEGPGEVEGADRKFLTGRNPPFYLGQCRLGSDEAWQDGLSVKVLDEPAPEMPECCTIEPPPFVGLSVLGATTFLYYNLPPPRTAWLRVKFTLVGVTNRDCTDCANLNRTFVLTRPGGHVNVFDGPDDATLCGSSFGFEFFFNAAIHQWQLSALGWEGGSGILAFTAAAWDQMSPLTLLTTALFDSACNGVPLTILIEQA